MSYIMDNEQMTTPIAIKIGSEPVSLALAESHWEYTKGILLKCHNSSKELIDFYEYLYIEAFKHGFKHGVEYVNDN